jgi:hypothetical protein
MSSITILKCFLFLAYNGPLFIGGWKYFSPLVLSVNGKPFEVLPIPFSDPKVNFDDDFGYGGGSLHPKNG